MRSSNGSVLSKIGFILGIVAICVFVIALVPCFGCINWLNIPFAVVGAIVNIIVIAQGNSPQKNITALILCGIAIVIGAIRLVLGAGIV